MFWEPLFILTIQNLLISLPNYRVYIKFSTHFEGAQMSFVCFMALPQSFIHKRYPISDQNLKIYSNLGNFRLDCLSATADHTCNYLIE